MSVSSVGRGEKLSKARGAGLTAKGRAKHNRATGQTSKAPVTEKNPEKANALLVRKVCARMSGVKGPIRDEKGKLTRRALP